MEGIHRTALSMHLTTPFAIPWFILLEYNYSLLLLAATVEHKNYP